MLKTRVIPILLLKDGLINKPLQFKRSRTVADPISVVRVFEERQVDELILLDIGSARYDEAVNADIVRDIADELSIPFSVGGGIRDVSMVREIIKAGAEKIVLNTGAVRTPNLISDSASSLGRQCVVVSIDAMKKEDMTYEVHIDNGREATGLDPVAWAREAQDHGAGEIIITSILQDGTMEGYDLELVRRVKASVTVPVIANGGAGGVPDFVDVVHRAGADAVAASSVFHFRRVTPNMVKEGLRQGGIRVRETYVVGT